MSPTSEECAKANCPPKGYSIGCLSSTNNLDKHGKQQCILDNYSCDDSYCIPNWNIAGRCQGSCATLGDTCFNFDNHLISLIFN